MDSDRGDLGVNPSSNPTFQAAGRPPARGDHRHPQARRRNDRQLDELQEGFQVPAIGGHGRGNSMGWPCGVARAARSHSSLRVCNASASTSPLSATSFSSARSQCS
jgi:hypothetical protein